MLGLICIGAFILMTGLFACSLCVAAARADDARGIR